jgi:hypothetical protein
MNQNTPTQATSFVDPTGGLLKSALQGRLTKVCELQMEVLELRSYIREQERHTSRRTYVIREMNRLDMCHSKNVSDSQLLQKHCTPSRWMGRQPQRMIIQNLIHILPWRGSRSSHQQPTKCSKQPKSLKVPPTRSSELKKDLFVI